MADRFAIPLDKARAIGNRVRNGIRYRKIDSEYTDWTDLINAGGVGEGNCKDFAMTGGQMLARWLQNIGEPDDVIGRSIRLVTFDTRAEHDPKANHVACTIWDGNRWRVCADTMEKAEWSAPIVELDYPAIEYCLLGDVLHFHDWEEAA